MIGVTEEKKTTSTLKPRFTYKKNSCTRRVQLPSGNAKEKTNVSVEISFDDDALELLAFFRKLLDSVSDASGWTTAPKEEEEKEKVADFLEEIYRLDGFDRDAAGDFVFDRIDRMICYGSFGLCDRILRDVEVKRLSTFVLTALLNITSAAKGPQLPSRANFFSRVRERVIEVRGAERAARILRGLE